MSDYNPSLIRELAKAAFPSVSEKTTIIPTASENVMWLPKPGDGLEPEAIEITLGCGVTSGPDLYRFGYDGEFDILVVKCPN
jgi:hypothetical protein